MSKGTGMGCRRETQAGDKKERGGRGTGIMSWGKKRQATPTQPTCRRKGES